MGDNNTGVADTGVPHWHPAPAAASKVAAKQAAFAKFQKSQIVVATSDSAVTGSVTPMTSCPPQVICNGTYAELANLVDHREGEGNGKKTYTCGPASTRNVVQTMTGVDYGENQWAIWENTSSVNGTYISNIANALNAHTAYGWAVDTPTSSSDLFNHVEEDVNAHYGIVENVLTNHLDFWGGHYARHYDMLYGYETGTGNVYVNEEWDSVYSVGTTYNGDNPYGQWDRSSSEIYSAVHASPTASIVW